MASPPAATNLIMNLVEMTEVRIESHKMQLPTKLRGTESDSQRANHGNYPVIPIYANGVILHVNLLTFLKESV